jgi:hypothetical protein
MELQNALQRLAVCENFGNSSESAAFPCLERNISKAQQRSSPIRVVADSQSNNHFSVEPSEVSARYRNVLRHEIQVCDRFFVCTIIVTSVPHPIAADGDYQNRRQRNLRRTKTVLTVDPSSLGRSEPKRLNIRLLRRRLFCKEGTLILAGS